MRLGLLTPLLALSLACSFDSQGTSDTNGDDVANTGSETAMTGSEEEIGTDQGTTQSDTSSESTGDGDGPTTESTDTASDSTTDTTESTTDATDTTESTTDTTTETTDTGMEIPPYGDCPGDGDCAMNEMCMHDFDISDNWQVCGTACGNASDCPDVGHPVVCIEQGFMSKACYLDCSMQDCPQGMNCKTAANLAFNKVCAFDS